MKTTNLFKFLSSETKLKIIIHLYMCSKAECDVQALGNFFQLKQANLSKHLASLKSAQIIKTKTKGLHVYYFINKDFCKQYHEILNWLVKQPQFEKFACSCNQTHIHNH